ncbi:WYL domain-containing protein [Paraburkholderia bengalensis]|uniref:WYL domain-containing protein n=1 Tax=Paraburkholderia bengalensis TaxID=2747562 RepID=A0ABU8ILB4_9BURK
MVRMIPDSPLARLDAMWLVLIWEGELGRSRVMKLFGIGETRASQWIKELREAYPDTMLWNTRTRTFKAIDAGYARFEQEYSTARLRAASLSRYLALTGLPLDDPGQRGDGIQWASYPDMSAPAPAIFSRLRQAILRREMVSIEYASMNNPEPHLRRIAPHGLIKAGRRWHVRAYCERAAGFRDFAIGRISGLEQLAIESAHLETEDTAWNTWVRVELVAHPGLSLPQAQVIQREFFNSGKRRVEQCRGSLLHYFLQDLMVAIEPATQQAPDYQLAVANPREIEPWLFR